MLSMLRLLSSQLILVLAFAPLTLSALLPRVPVCAFYLFDLAYSRNRYPRLNLVQILSRQTPLIVDHWTIIIRRDH